MLYRNDNISTKLAAIYARTRKTRQVKGLSQMAAKAAYATDNQEILGYCESEPQLYQ